MLGAINIKKFTKKYIDYFLNDFDPESSSYYDFFDSSMFPNECSSLGFEIDCGQNFIEAYGEEAWESERGLSKVIGKMNNLQVIGSGLFSKWRYFNHWSYGHATEEDKKWFLMLLRRMQELSSSADANNM